MKSPFWNSSIAEKLWNWNIYPYFLLISQKKRIYNNPFLEHILFTVLCPGCGMPASRGRRAATPTTALAVDATNFVVSNDAERSWQKLHDSFGMFFSLFWLLLVIYLWPTIDDSTTAAATVAATFWRLLFRGWAIYEFYFALNF